MKTLTIIRHAKSSWDHPGLHDHDRPLNERGQKDAPRIGLALRERGVLPDVILSSTANRAFTTAQIIAETIGFEGGIEQKSDIYLASPGKLLQIVNGIDEEVDSAMIFGHNPGFHQLADGLVGGYGEVDHFPTCAVARLQFETETWGEIGQGDATLIDHFYPKSL